MALTFTPNIRTITRVGWRPALMGVDASGELVGVQITKTPGITGFLSFARALLGGEDVSTEYTEAANHYYRPRKLG